MNLKSLIPSTNRLRITEPFGSLYSDFDRMVGELGRSFPAFRSTDVMPRLDVSETDQAIEITAELPGLEEKDVEIDFTDDVLTIKGEKKSEKEEKEQNRYISERTYGSFLRSIQLPSGIDPAKIEASIDKGVLTVKVPKPAPTISKKIEIKKS
jgi:HSP20 family protein